MGKWLLEVDKPVVGKWMADAACVGEDPEMWFPTGAEPVAPEVVAMCAACPVRVACLDYALTPPREMYGIWGGLTARRRLTLYGYSPGDREREGGGRGPARRRGPGEAA